MGWSPFRPVGLTYRDSRSFGGYTLITPIGGNSVFLLDDLGRIVHRWQAQGFQPGYGYLLHGGNLLVRGQPLVDTEVGVGEPAGRTDILLELDWESNEIWRWEHEGFHHDMHRLPNGNTLVIIWEVLPTELAGRIKGGLNPKLLEQVTGDDELMDFFLLGMGVGGRPRLKGILSDAVLEIDSNGKPVHVWHAYEHLDPEVDTICPLCFPGEWSHANAIEATPDGGLLLSFRELSTIMKISWPEGKVLWKWGRPNISHQHNTTLTPEGNVLVFDNGTHHPIQGKSRIVEVDMNSNKIVWQYVPSPVFSLLSGHIGGCERLANGNTLICEGESGRIFEITTKGEYCWEWNNPFVFNFKGIENVQLFRAHRYTAEGPQLQNRRLDFRAYEDLNRKLDLLKND